MLTFPFAFFFSWQLSSEKRESATEAKEKKTE